MVSQVVLLLHRKKYNRLWWKNFTSAAINLDGDHGGASPKNTSAFTRASNKLAKSCKYLDKTLLIRNSFKSKKNRSVFQLESGQQVGTTQQSMQKTH